MDDFEREVADRLWRHAEDVVPADDVPALIRERVARRQRHRRVLLAAVPVACLLVVTAAFAAVAGLGTAPSTRSASPAATSTHPHAAASAPSLLPATSTTTPPFAPSAGGPLGASSGAGGQTGDGAPATPAPPSGWLPVDLAGARLFVPPGSVVTSVGCPDRDAPVTVFLRGRNTPPDVVFCPFEPATVTTVTLELLPSGATTSGLSAVPVNGITTYRNGGGPGSVGAVLVPSLGVEVASNGPDSGQVLATLSRSPRTVVLARGHGPRVPRGWRRATFGGLRLAVPGAWSVRSATPWSPPCQVLPPWEVPGLVGSQPELTLDAGAAEPPVACPAIALAPTQPVRPPVDGVVVDPGPNGPLSPSATYGSCRSIHGLRACVDQDYPYGVLVLRVVEPSGKAVAVALGLGGSGRTARTVLFSLRPG